MSKELLQLGYLDLLRGFVAVARRMSITRAAEDLYLTQSAVSRQISSLEESLGVKLFVREHRAIRLTPHGENFYQTAEKILSDLIHTVSSFKEEDTARALTIAVSASMSAFWLLPRLANLRHLHPELNINIISDNNYQNLEAEGINLALRASAANIIPNGGHFLFKELYAPVCHPSLCKTGMDLSQLMDSQPLIELNDPSRPWARWSKIMRTYGLRPKPQHKMVQFSQYDQVLLACMSGQGVAMGRVSLLEKSLNEKQLMIVSGVPVIEAANYGYWLLEGDRSSRQAEIDSVIDWLLQEAVTSRKTLETMIHSPVMEVRIANTDL